MNKEQAAAKTEINRLANKLLGLLNSGNPYTDSVVSNLRDISNQINYQINDLNNYEPVGDLLTADDYPDEDPEDLIG